MLNLICNILLAISSFMFAISVVRIGKQLKIHNDLQKLQIYGDVGKACLSSTEQRVLNCILEHSPSGTNSTQIEDYCSDIIPITILDALNSLVTKNIVYKQNDRYYIVIH